MNRDSVNEYISWLEKFREIYKKYIDEKKWLNKYFTETLEKFQKILSGNNTNSTEENIIRLLKELVKEFSNIYDKNKNINKTSEGPRNTNKFKQDIYNTEIAKLKEWLMDNINNTKLFPNFESIVMYVAKKRQMIEFLKLGKVIDIQNFMNISHAIYFEVFGKRRIQGDFTSPLFHSHAKHLYDEKSRLIPIKITYTFKGKKIDLTYYNNQFWYHTNYKEIPKLFQIMNDLYSEFLSLVNGHNNTSKKDILPELYWLYMQACPFERGSAAIGEILFSVLLRKNFKGCDFLISNGWNGDPLTIPDIHALHYQLDHFKSIFWDQFTNCGLKKKSNNNNRTNLQGNIYFYYL
jgi:hypothetical protein